MKKKSRYKIRLITIIASAVLLVALIFVFFLKGKRSQPQVEMMITTKADILYEAADIMYERIGDTVTFGEVCQAFGSREVPDRISWRTDWPKDKNSLDYKLFDMCRIYEKEFYISEDEWYELYDMYLSENRLDSQIYKIEMVPLGCGLEIYKSLEGDYLEDGMLHTIDGDYFYESKEFETERFNTVLAYIKDNNYLVVKSVVSYDSTIKNAWILDDENGKAVFYQNYKIYLDRNRNHDESCVIEDSNSNRVCDISFLAGQVNLVVEKDQILRGKVLSFTADQVEILDAGTFAISQDAQFYNSIEEVRNTDISDITLGYDFTEFILENDQICAVNVVTKDFMDKVRVLIDAADYSGRLHDTVKLTADTPFVIKYGPLDDQKTDSFLAGETVEIQRGDTYFANGRRIFISTESDSGKITIKNANRSLGTPSYKGEIEIALEDEGLSLVNEVDLEQYLYSVVPSEMPSSYPPEALKVQAVCARTYAYSKMLRAGLANFGAHMDDSASYQVYNNISEQGSTNAAVNATKGQLLYYGDNTVTTYFYSTSMGYSVDGSRWGNPQDTPYLVTKGIDSKEVYKRSGNKPSGMDLMDNEVFDKVIKTSYSEDYESDESFYRWSYKDIDIDIDLMNYRIEDLYNTNNAKVEVMNSEGQYESGLPQKFDCVTSIEPGERRPGGTLYTLLITTEKDRIKIIGENNVGYILTDGKTKVTLQNGKTYSAEKFLPSPWWTVDVVTKDGFVVGYSIIGGGFGHGCGMSQIAAKHMANSGLTCKEILEFFYEGCQVR